jgi:hypothetical protein
MCHMFESEKSLGRRKSLFSARKESIYVVHSDWLFADSYSARRYGCYRGLLNSYPHTAQGCCAKSRVPNDSVSAARACVVFHNRISIFLSFQPREISKFSPIA